MVKYTLKNPRFQQVYLFIKELMRMMSQVTKQIDKINYGEIHSINILPGEIN